MWHFLRMRRPKKYLVMSRPTKIVLLHMKGLSENDRFFETADLLSFGVRRFSNRANFCAYGLYHTRMTFLFDHQTSSWEALSDYAMYGFCT